MPYVKGFYLSLLILLIGMESIILSNSFLFISCFAFLCKSQSSMKKFAAIIAKLAGETL